eukprot:CAMPEP_0117436436 /NCGR_PEP_ID=MMETSP0759-20121206/1006_1 /TAXON_ID=63605 /ORGANISM="Percolomonas cosmopolitus, Strain WS" /LENGTH=1130 /DNA_ID=CAMNT_0005228035 /DNA_START=2005 /DNA_END=5393 /DNA_ORIENTATION=+
MSSSSHDPSHGASHALKDSLTSAAIPSSQQVAPRVFFPPSFVNRTEGVHTRMPSPTSSGQLALKQPLLGKPPVQQQQQQHQEKHHGRRTDSIQNPPCDFCTMTVEEVANWVNLHPLEYGLTTKEARLRLKRYGANSLKHTNYWWPVKMLFSHTCNFMNVVLFGAAAISLAVREWIDAGVIFFVILLNICIGVVQDFRSSRTMKALQKLSQTECDVTRDGTLAAVETISLVVGDVVHLKEGDIVPADLRLFRATVLEIDESTLTGESEAIIKDALQVFPDNTPLGDRINMVFSGSIVLKGKGRGIVVRTAFKTEMGKIATSITKTKQRTPKIVTRMNMLGLVLVLLGAVAFGLMMIGMAIHKQMPIWPDGVESGITTLVAIVPESLAPVLTLTMTLGVLKMVKEKTIVRKLTALESLGNVDHIATDKTGTLTKGRMQMTSLVVSGARYEITGGAVEPIGEVHSSSGKKIPFENLSPAMLLAATISSLCNSSTVKQIPESSRMNKKHHRKLRERRHKKTLREGDWVAIGSPTEIALQVFSLKLGVNRTSLCSHAPYAPYPELIREYAFDSSIKRMTVVYRSNLPEDKDHYFVVSKGAPDAFIAGLCSHEIVNQNNEVRLLDEQSIESICSTQELMASEGLRVLCLAFRRIPIQEFVDDRDAVERDLTLLGLCGIYDAPRESVFDSIRMAHEAGIIVHMVTGDYKSTALTIAKEIGIIKDIETQAHLVTTASEFDSLTEQELKEMKQLPLVIARCTPESKVKLVDALHARNKVVAMTGDGVNDSAAIKASDVGIVMGRGGSDVSREVADIILTDDDFSSIVVAIQEGRRVFSSIRKFIIHMLSTNVSQTIILVVSVLIGLMPPLNPTQVLFLNMISAGPPPSIALGSSGDDEGIMDRKVRPVHEDLFTWDSIVDIGFYGVTMGLVVLGIYLLARYRFQGASYEEAQAVAFGALTLTMLLHAYNCRDRYRPFFDRGFYESYKLHAAVLFGLIVTICITYIPWVNRVVFHVMPLTLTNLLEIFLAAIVFMVLCEIYKGVKRQVRHWYRQMRKSHLDEIDQLYGRVQSKEVEHDEMFGDSSDEEAPHAPAREDSMVINVPKSDSFASGQSQDEERARRRRHHNKKYPMSAARQRLL